MTDTTSSSFMSKWTLEEALELIRGLEPNLSKCGYHVALCGGVLQQGRSEHDLDVLVYPHNSTNNIDIAQLRLCLRDLGWKLRMRAEYLVELWIEKGSNDRKHVDIWATPDRKRVDVFVPTVLVEDDEVSE